MLVLIVPTIFTGYSAYDAIVHRVATFWKS